MTLPVASRLNPLVRVTLITGGNGGLGLATARRFLQDPESRVWLGVRSSRDRAEALRAEHPERCSLVSLEVTEPTAWKEAVASILAANGQLDVLVNNAGTHDDALLGTMSPDVWSRVVSTNLDSVFHGCQAVLPTLISQRRGRIVNVSSLSALLAPAGQTNYAAAKAGVIALTQSLAKEVARLQITVNAVCPGYIDTEALAKLPPEKRSAMVGQIPARRLGRPEEVAAAIHFLASPEASYITGSVLKVDGGIL